MARLPNSRASRSGRERGAIFATALVVLLFIFVLASGLSQLSVVNLRSSAESSQRMRALYLADSGAHAGHFKIDAAGGSIADTTFTETLAGQSASVDITNMSSTHIRVTSDATVGNSDVNVEMMVELVTTYEMTGGFEIYFRSGVELSGAGIPIRLDNNAVLSGKNHDSTGALLTDQSAAVHGLTMNAVPGDLDFVLTQAGGVTLEGVPAASSNAVDVNTLLRDGLRSYAQASATVVVSGGVVLDDDDTGSYGTSSLPVVVFVDLGQNNTFQLEDSFEGHGTLFLDVTDAETARALYMRQDAVWHGPVVVYLRGEAEHASGSLVEMKNNARVIGGVMMHFAGEDVDVGDSGDVLYLRDSAQILYSSSLIANAPGMSSLPTTSTRISSYRIE